MSDRIREDEEWPVFVTLTELQASRIVAAAASACLILGSCASLAPKSRGVVKAYKRLHSALKRNGVRHWCIDDIGRGRTQKRRS